MEKRKKENGVCCKLNPPPPVCVQGLRKSISRRLSVQLSNYSPGRAAGTEGGIRIKKYFLQSLENLEIVLGHYSRETLTECWMGFLSFVFWPGRRQQRLCRWGGRCWGSQLRGTWGQSASGGVCPAWRSGSGAPCSYSESCWIWKLLLENWSQ